MYARKPFSYLFNSVCIGDEPELNRWVSSPQLMLDSLDTIP